MKLLLFLLMGIANPTFSLFEYDKAINKAHKGDCKGASDDLKKLVAHNPQSAQLAYDAGVAAYQSQNYDEAVQFFTVAAENATEKQALLKQQAHFNAGNVHMQRKEWDKAITAYQTVLSLDKTNERAQHNLNYAQKMKQQEQHKQQEQQKSDDQNDDQKKDKDSESESSNSSQDQKNNDDSKKEQKDSTNNKQNQSPDTCQQHEQSQEENKDESNKDSSGTNQQQNADKKNGKDNKSTQNRSGTQQQERMKKDNRNQQKSEAEKKQQEKDGDDGQPRAGQGNKHDKNNHEGQQKDSPAESIGDQQDTKKNGTQQHAAAEQRDDGKYRKAAPVDKQMQWIERLLQEQDKSDQQLNKVLIKSAVDKHDKGVPDEEYSW